MVKKKTTDGKALASGYAALLKKVKQALVTGQRKVEQEKVSTYWKTGKLIQEHILAGNDRADHGSQLFEKLALDLEVDATVLRKTVQFVKAYPNCATWRNLSWAHFRKLMTIPNRKLRLEYTARANKEKWTVIDLERKLDAELSPDNAAGTSPKKSRRKFKAKPPQLKGKLGTLYYYRIRKSESLHQVREGFDAIVPETLHVDLGFKTYRNLAALGSGPLEEGDYVRSVPTNHAWEYNIEKVEASEADLYTYEASLERVVDGDTLLVHVSLGFNLWKRVYLRLRGINTPEIDTAEGLSARNYVKRRFEKISRFLLTSSRSDKYDRYLADVWLPDPKKEDVRQFLNQELLDQGVAVLAPS